jgi:hypothetical protein
MLLNPYRHNLAVVPGTRILSTELGLSGVAFDDPGTPGRRWTITGVYAPVSSRRLGGIRVKLEDQKNFITFCNQRDLEVLLGLAAPGDWCQWTDQEYPGPKDHEWYGFAADWEDLADDMLEREYSLRVQFPGVLPFGLEVTRRVHVDGSHDVEELSTMLYDCDPQTGMGPDMRLETIDTRWTRVGRDKILWKRI